MTAEPEEKPKLGITIVHDGSTIQIKVKATMAFKKVFEAAEKKFGKDPGTLKFVYDGTRVSPEDTPAGLGMDDGDQLDAFLQQLGGSMPSCYSRTSIH
ncbi:hypothetical protein AAF712_005992 [Marasmius tenuissimus]|uniref:Ubiquitin-like domain-containing protein n=1 Tax=Marasmius tenuissimus TaxID=585030 RepID=A0ABR3A034_9AGAR|nr:hypothetical protein PM082_021008 [Marasmius tenuissimus]